MEATISRDTESPARAAVPWVAVLGPDGSGKTSVIEALTQRLAPRVAGVHVYHWRPGYLRPSTGDQAVVTDPHADPPRGLLTSLLKLVFLFLDWQLGYRGVLAGQLANNNLVLFDRSYVDMLVDPRRYRYGGPLRLAEWMSRLIPQPDVFVLLDAPEKVLQARKREVTPEECARQRSRYKALVGGMPNGYVVDTARPLSDVVADVERIIVGSMN